MAAFSVYLEDALLNLTLNGTAFTPSGDTWIALFTAGTGLDSNAPTSEVAAGDYLRLPVTNGGSVEFSASSAGVSQTSAALSWGPSLVNWGIISHIAVMDAVTSGNVYYWGALPASADMGIGLSLTLSAGELKVALS